MQQFRHRGRIGSKADMCSAKRHVRFGPEADMVKQQMTGLFKFGYVNFNVTYVR